MNIQEILKKEIELYFSTVSSTDREKVKDCSGIIYNIIVKYNPSPSDIQKVCSELYGNLTFDKIPKHLFGT